ncbi:hypothetical protein ABEB36_012404 [Hypothenemus hampei]|uniref:SAC3/GANP/THP3 conserved domain-containing protein n=1 Tax=Hypothenemus hampei TaxID=57062 RepID=A0ABD1EBU5_HYPHA
MQAKQVTGRCMSMCPDKEIKWREEQKLLHILEMVTGTENSPRPTADRKKVVKSFARSAAGKYLLDPNNLRPPDVLLHTVKYLLTEVIKTDKIPWHIVYDFIMDRLRSVRQDMVVQEIAFEKSIDILQPIVMFYAYSSYRLSEEPLAHFDPHINKTHLLECLKRLLCYYDESGRLKEDSPLRLDKKQINFRFLFEALYLVTNAGDVAANEILQLSFSLSMSYRQNNFVRFCRLIEKLPIQLQCVAALHLPEIRRCAFKIMSVAYNSKNNLMFPLELLKNLLLFNNIVDVKNCCDFYGFKCTKNDVVFVKSDFDGSKTNSFIHLDFIDDVLQTVDICDLVLMNLK